VQGVGKEATFLATLAIALAVAPAVALGANRYVDSTGSNSGTACAQVAPCLTIAYALANSSAGDTIVIDNGTYNESVTVGDGRSLEAQDFVAADGNGPTIIDGGTATAISVPASGAGHIRGLTIRSNATVQVDVSGTVEIDSNGFDDPDSTNGVGVQVNSGADGTNIHDNTFVDPSPSTTRSRIAIYSPFTPVTIQDNDVQNQNVGIQAGLVNPGQTLIAGNEITGTHNLPFGGQAVIASASGGGTTIVRGNEITDAADTSTNGISAVAGSTLVRNEVTGHNVGVDVGNDQTGITLFGDRLWGNTVGLRLFDTGAAPPKAAASLVHVTAVDNVADIAVSSGTLSLDSSIVETLPFSGSASCTISYSRADAIGADPSGCNAFQTTASPAFVDASTGDYHLAPGSPMIDMGNPADPPLGAVDFDGDPRAVDATPACSGNVARRDIGADEFVPSPIDCEPPNTTIDTGPNEGSATSDTTPTFTFSSEPNATFECSMDGASSFGACSGTGEHTPEPLPDGPYTFAVRANDEAANVETSPATRSFTVDTAAPDTTITAGPRKRTRKRTARFNWEADDATSTSFACAIDAKPFSPCSEPKTYRNLSPGPHRLRVRATDAAGNVEAAPAVRRWRVLARR
jgi:hypothetical protein